MKRNPSLLILSITAVSLLTFASLRAQEKKVATNDPQRSRSFTEALAEARRLADTDAGKVYQNEFGKIVGPRLGDIVGECTRNLGPTVKLEVVFVLRPTVNWNMC
jgi:hypothetical protein